MALKILRKIGIGLFATIIVIGSFAVWAHFAQRELDADEMARLAKEQELLDRRYPVKAGKPKPKPALAPLPVRDVAPARAASGDVPASLHSSRD
jgi:hypothetical protein